MSGADRRVGRRSWHSLGVVWRRKRHPGLIASRPDAILTAPPKSETPKDRRQGQASSSRQHTVSFGVQTSRAVVSWMAVALGTSPMTLRSPRKSQAPCLASGCSPESWPLAVVSPRRRRRSIVRSEGRLPGERGLSYTGAALKGFVHAAENLMGPLSELEALGLCLRMSAVRLLLVEDNGRLAGLIREARSAGLRRRLVRNGRRRGGRAAPRRVCSGPARSRSA